MRKIKDDSREYQKPWAILYSAITYLIDFIFIMRMSAPTYLVLGHCYISPINPATTL